MGDAPTLYQSFQKGIVNLMLAFDDSAAIDFAVELT